MSPPSHLSLRYKVICKSDISWIFFTTGTQAFPPWQNQFEAGTSSYGTQSNVTFQMHKERFTIKLARYNFTKHSKQEVHVQSVTETPKSARTNGPLTNLSKPSKALSKKGRSSSTTETIAHFLRLSYILKFVTSILLDCCVVVDVRLH